METCYALKTHRVEIHKSTTDTEARHYNTDKQLYLLTDSVDMSKSNPHLYEHAIVTLFQLRHSSTAQYKAFWWQWVIRLAHTYVTNHFSMCINYIHYYVIKYLEYIISPITETDLENMEARAVVAEAKVSEKTRAQEIERSIQLEREGESIRSDRERGKLEELKKECEIMRMKLQQAGMKANELQEKLEENERKEREKMQVDTKLYNEERLIEVNKFEREKDEVIAEKTVKVTNEEQHIVWEGYGLRLHIPSNSLPEDCSELKINITVSRARDCELPDEDGVFVSAVYSFSHNLGERKLRKKVTLEMQHCAQGLYIPLCIVQSDSIVPPHEFQTLQGGKFDSSDRYASIELDHFCRFGVYLALYTSRNLKTCASLYYTNIKCDSFHFYLYIVPHLDAILKVFWTLSLFFLLSILGDCQ